MNAILLTIIIIPVIEIYLFIEIGGKIGALYTISLIFITACYRIYYARYEGFNTLRSGMGQMMRNELPIYEIISGAALAFAALLLIIPGFATDLVRIFNDISTNQKIIFYKIFKKIFKRKKIK